MGGFCLLQKVDCNENYELRASTEKRLKSSLRKFSPAIEEFFRDFDRLNSGKINRNQFRQGLDRFELVLSAEEIESLAKHYEEEFRGEKLVNWRKFCSSINSGLSWTLSPKSNGS
jgi:Ca2+-binding EF-hand superfamily protein